MDSLSFLSSSFTNVLLFILLYFEVFLIVTFFENYQKIKQERTHGTITLSRYPTATIVVPCFNEEQTVSKTIHSLLSLNYPKESFKIFIVDDGSTDGTWNHLSQYRDHPQITLLQKENGGKHTALNMAIAQSSSEIIGCLDADSFVDKDALLKIAKRFNEQPEIMAITPCIFVHEPQNLLQQIQKAMYTMSTFLRYTFALLGSLYITPGPFSFFRREVFAIVGPYKEAHHTEDLEIALRMQKHGLIIENVYDAAVYTVTPNTFKKLFRQQRRWTYGFIQNAYDYRKEFFFNKHYGNLGLIVLPMATLSIFSVLYFLALSIYQLASVVSDYLTRFHAIGFTFTPPDFSFSLFNINTEALNLLTIAALCTVIFMLLAGKWMMEKRIRISKDLVYFTFLYSFLAPWWIISALWNAIISRKPSWR